MSAKRCVVIGAGLAGLAAGYELAQEEWEVVVLEADRKRLGGRVFTKREPKGNPGEWDGKSLVYEIGGEWIGLDHERVIKLCCEFGLSLMPHQYSFAFLEDGKRSRFYKPGELPFRATENQRVKEFLKKAQNFRNGMDKQLDRIDWWTQVKELKLDLKSMLRRDLMDSTDFGESIRHTSGFVGMSEYGFGNLTDEMDKKVVGGNDLLVYALAKAIEKKGGQVIKGQEVRRIEQRGRKVRVFAKGTRDPVTADACICTIPAMRLLEIEWNPPLPPKHEWAAKELQYARIVKTAVWFPKRFWPTFEGSGFSLFTSEASDFCFESTYGQRDGEGPGIICSYAVGDKADDIADEDEWKLAKWLSEDLRTALKTSRVKGKFLWRQAWQRQNCIGGAYAFYRPGQWFEVRPTLQTAHQRVFFAGEHVSERWQGFMEGAVETGQEAARTVVRL